jgi:hypothetical protein
MDLRKMIEADEAKDAQYEWDVTGTEEAQRLRDEIWRAMQAYYDYLSIKHDVLQGDEAMVATMPGYNEACIITLKGSALDKVYGDREPGMIDPGTLDS